MKPAHRSLKAQVKRRWKPTAMASPVARWKPAANSTSQPRAGPNPRGRQRGDEDQQQHEDERMHQGLSGRRVHIATGGQTNGEMTRPARPRQLACRGCSPWAPLVPRDGDSIVSRERHATNVHCGHTLKTSPVPDHGRVYAFRCGFSLAAGTDCPVRHQSRLRGCRNQLTR